jgi:SAM-dependent methyltransferase
MAEFFSAPSARENVAWRRSLTRRLRALRLLDLADYVAFLKDAWAQRAANAAFRADNDDLPLPPLWMVYEVHSSTLWDHFIARGRAHAAAIAQVLDAYGPDRALRVLEWGCGPGRVTRHLAGAMGARLGRLTGIDVNPRFVSWARANLGGATFLPCAADPPLNIAPAQFDAIFAISILTHLSTRRISLWLAEHRRMLRPDGVLVLTIHTVDSALTRLQDTERRRYLAGETVEFAQVREGGRAFATYTPLAHIAALGQEAGLSLVAHISDGVAAELGQDIIVLRAEPA